MEVPRPRNNGVPPFGGPSHHTRLLIIDQANRDNHGNFEKSGPPFRILCFRRTLNGGTGGGWKDVPNEAMEIFRRRFASRTPTFHLKINNRSCLVDLHRMIIIDLLARCECSIAWIDNGGRCFFPKRPFDFSSYGGDSSGGTVARIEEERLSNVGRQFIPDLNLPPLDFEDH